VTLFLTDADVQAVFDWAAAVEALRAAYAAPQAAQALPPRTMARGDGVWLRTLSGLLPDGSAMGSKLIAASPRARKASYLISLFDQATMELAALLDGNAITGFRTAATSALAVSVAAPDKPLRVAVLGSGFEAQKHFAALCATRRVASAAVFSPRAESRQRFAEAFKGVELDRAAMAEDALRGADVVVCAARARDESPVLLGRWLRPGMTVVSIGSTLPEQREVDVDTTRRADVIVCDALHEVAHETGDMLAARKAGVSFDDKVMSLADAVGGRVDPRRSDEAIVLYKSVGSALQDLTVAHMCLRRARERGLGTVLPVTIAPVSK
jgi:ornithine cyclodeaminase/alanine dehydrogenase